MGGNVFKGQTSAIEITNINPTLTAYFKELAEVFPNKSSIFNVKTFHPIGSTGKVPVSNDIDLAVDSLSLLDKEMSDRAVAEWDIDPKEVGAEFQLLTKRARTATPQMLRMKAFLKLLTRKINERAPTLHTDESKVTDGNIFGLFGQCGPGGKPLNIGVQIDWMIGDIAWLKFSYYSAACPAGSNVKGLHRTQLMLSAFQIADLSFNHINGVKDKATGMVVAHDPEQALAMLSIRLGFKITQEDAENYYQLNQLLKINLKPADYSKLLDIYFKILDSTRVDIPDNLQDEWIERRRRLGLTGKFLPDESVLKAEVL
jgi:hypothetical protein